MANLLDLPNEVLESSILPFLSWNDLLRSRRVCKAIKGITDDYIRLNPQKAPEIEVTEQTDKDLKAFIAMGIHTTKLFIDNPNGHQFYDNLDTVTLTKFTSTYGPKIRSLRVVEFSVYLCYNERTFLKSLPNLKAFEADHYGFGVVNSVDQLQTVQSDQFLRAMSDPQIADSPNLMGVEVLKIGHNKQYWIGEYANRFFLIFGGNMSLDHVSLPFGAAPIKASLVDPSHRSGENFFNLLKVLGGMLFARNDDGDGGQKNLKFFDFINYHKERGMEIEIIDQLHLEQCFDLIAFIKVCTDFGVKLLNVNPAWYHQLNNINPSFRLAIHGNPVVSLVNLHASVFTLDMPNLERITIYQTSRSNVSPTWNVQRPNWPALKILEINVNSKKAVETETPMQDTALLFKFLWKDIVRGQLTELSLKFEDEKGKEGVAIPKTEDIASGCPNLRKLRIVKWPGKQKALISLWTGLPKLEEVSLEYCRDMGNVTFVGEDVNNPVFFQLKNLRKLGLKGSDEMPKVTDTLFGLVLAHMKLTHLWLTSDKPLEKVTKRGINALLEGDFAGSIEKFPFHGWSLATMSAEDFKETAKRFRSFNMI